jgi:phytoene desaturase
MLQNIQQNMREPSTKKIAVIGAGFAGLASACSLAHKGFDVTLLEKNHQTGGRGRAFQHQGYSFDMGPSWYWMPEIFEQFFNKFGKKVSDYYELQRLDPSYRVFFQEGDPLDVPAAYEEFKQMVESFEPGAGSKMDRFMAEAKIKYDVSMADFVWKPSLSILEFAQPRLLIESFRLHLFSGFSSHAKKYFKHPKIIQLLEFPILFLGAKPEKTPAMYSMMNYADIMLGTWYPKGGMCKIAEAMTTLAKELGVRIITSATVNAIDVSLNEAHAIAFDGKTESFDAVVAAADYQHVESKLLAEKYRSYTEEYWNKRVMSPSSLLFYIGVNRKVSGILHHNLFFDEPFDRHAQEIYDNPAWPKNPLFYLCCTSATDSAAAPDGKENLFILIPVAPGLQSDESERMRYLKMCLERIKRHTGEDIEPDIEYVRSYAHEEFISDYNAFKGNAYGLANTLMQTAVMKPRMKSKKVKNLFYTGQLTVPGPGVPPSIISGQIVANEVEKYFQNR